VVRAEVQIMTLVAATSVYTLKSLLGAIRDMHGFSNPPIPPISSWGMAVVISDITSRETEASAPEFLHWSEKCLEALRFWSAP
jgi:hypothetical protein